MNNQSRKPQGTVDLTIRRMRVLWLGTLGSLAGLYVLTLFTERPEDAEPDMLFLIFIGIALTITLASFVVKKHFFSRAVTQQQVELVQQGFIVASAMTEVAALLGLFDYFRTGNRYYYVLFIIAAGAQLLHFPRREHIFNASFRDKADSTVGYGL